MFFWNSLAFLMIQQMLTIWSLVPLPFLKPGQVEIVANQGKEWVSKQGKSSEESKVHSWGRVLVPASRDVALKPSPNGRC